MGSSRAVRQRDRPRRAGAYPHHIFNHPINATNELQERMMYCKKCYADLSLATQPKCPGCARPFNPDNPATFLVHPFPTKKRMLFHLLITTILALGASLVVATFQAAQSSGH